MHGGGEGRERGSRPPPWVPEPPITSKNSAHNCCLAVKILLEGSVLNDSLPVPRKSTTASREPLGDPGAEIGSGPDTPGITVPPVPVCFFCISKRRLEGRRQWGLTLFPCHPPLTCLAPALGPPLLPLGIRVITPGCLQRKPLITDHLESSHPRCRRIVCVLSHLISTSANFFCFCCSYNRLSQS